MRPSTPSRWLERSALALGLASSVGLVVAAFTAFGNPREAGWSRLNELVSGARANVEATWSVVTRVDGPLAPGASSALVEWTPEEAARAAEATATRSAEPDAPFEGSSALFDALFAESQTAELVRGDAREALTLVEEALNKSAPAADLAAARLRAVQLAVRVEDAPRARAHATRAWGDSPADARTGGAPTRALALLVTLPALPAEERVEFARPLVDAWTSGELAFEGDVARLERIVDDAGERFAPVECPLESVLRARLLDACARPAEFRLAFDAYDARRLRQAFAAHVGRLPVDGSLSTTHWTVFASGADLLCVRRVDVDRFAGHLARRSTFEGAIRERLAGSSALPASFLLDFDGTHADSGEAVGAPIELSPAWPRATLRHPDVAAVLRSAESRTAWLRGGLVVLALAVAGAAAATVFALRRERRLAEARTSFVAAVSHELRTPIASILLMSENLESGRAGANAPRYHALIRRETLRLRRLVDDVLDFSRLERGRRFDARLEDVEPASWFDALAEEARDLCASAGVTFTATRGALPAHVLFDAEAVRRAALNLVVNALRHSGSRTVDLAVNHDGRGELVLTVADRGKGVPPREREAIFEPFARLAGSESTPGAGLGLAIVREIAVAHGGTALVRAADEGPGAVFELRLRVEADHDPARTPNVEPRSAAAAESHSTTRKEAR